MKKNPALSLLKEAQTAYVDTQNLLPLLKAYANPRDYLARLVEQGDLIRLKNGFFVIAEKIFNEPVPYPQIANLLYGPSYISFEWALSFYGMIPEGVYVLSSCSASKSKIFRTPLGVFDYFYLNHARYSIGIDQKENGAGKFLIATPEKALIDLVQQKCKHLKSKDLFIDLVEARRIDPSYLKNLNSILISEIAERYSSETVYQLIHALKLL